MAVLSPAATEAGAPAYVSQVGGAEFNVAASLARLGTPAAWVSRLGDDGFGAQVLGEAAACSIDTAGVEIDPARPTGLYVKHTTHEDGIARSSMRYYRTGSAASAIDPAFLDSAAVDSLLRRARVVHVSGITPALSAGTAEAMAGLRDRLPSTAVLSVDLNLRPALWAGRDRSALSALVGQADLLFAGADEARAHFGHADPALLFAGNPVLTTIVIKDDDRAAASYLRGPSGIQHVIVPALRVSVVEPIGAGDAFAAGYLSAMIEGRPEPERLRIAHALASLALVSRGDRPETVPDRGERDRIARTPDWGSWTVARGSSPWEAE
jgi:2-dehydro-3-deoxygluconokinase